MTGPRVIAPPRPAGVVHRVMCRRCPFRADGTGYAQDHEDLPRIIAAVEAGHPFYCHETALKDPRTRLNAAGDPDGVQPHFELCRGGHERRMKVWRDRVTAAGYTPGDEIAIACSTTRPDAQQAEDPNLPRLQRRGNAAQPGRHADDGPCEAAPAVRVLQGRRQALVAADVVIADDTDQVRPEKRLHAAAVKKFGSNVYVQINRCTKGDEDDRCSEPDHVVECSGEGWRITVGRIVDGQRRPMLLAYAVDDMLSMLGRR